MEHKNYFEKAEDYTMKSDNHVRFKVFMGGELDEPLSCLEMGNTTEYQIINLIVVLKDTLEELKEDYPKLYKEALRTKTSHETYTTVEEIK